jgi:hypothetical protein
VAGLVLSTRTSSLPHATQLPEMPGSIAVLLYGWAYPA